MDKKAIIVTGIVLVITIFAVGIGLKHKPTPKNPQANRVQTMPRNKIQKRNEALIYISDARSKAEKGNLKEATELCNKALELAPDEPITQNCKEMIKHINK